MKKILMMLAMVQMMICSCMKPEIENTQIKEPAAGEVVFTAVIEQTKALPSAGGVVSWTENEEIGVVLRAKGIVDSVDGEWIYFDYIPGSIDIRRGNADVIGKLCVIGSNINKDKIKELFKV